MTLRCQTVGIDSTSIDSELSEGAIDSEQFVVVGWSAWPEGLVGNDAILPLEPLAVLLEFQLPLFC